MSRRGEGSAVAETSSPASAHWSYMLQTVMSSVLKNGLGKTEYRLPKYRCHRHKISIPQHQDDVLDTSDDIYGQNNSDDSKLC